ncbi:MAG: alcohol dehydrogenase catalytic domain-containing protein [Corynebacterium sp.]|nr:alcohol dehydrogenase catalytic domain-containing protein [Corynebacterium sp.]
MYAYAVQFQDCFRGLQRVEIPTPWPKPGEVSVEVRYAGLGIIDAFWVAGTMPAPAGFIPGLEVSGIVHELGEGVTGFEIGDEGPFRHVIGTRCGHNVQYGDLAFNAHGCYSR